MGVKKRIVKENPKRKKESHEIYASILHDLHPLLIVLGDVISASL